MKLFDKIRYGLFGMALAAAGAFIGPAIADQVIQDNLSVTGTINAKGAISGGTNVGLVSGGSTVAAICSTTTAGFCVYFGTGTPTISAAQGSIYLNNAGSSSSTRIYVNSTGSTTWVAVTTAS